VTTGATIAPAASPADLDAARRLFRAYAASLPIDLGYQDFQVEVDGLPGAYAAPGGALLLARAADGAAVGCVALRAFPIGGACEMKRLYVSPEGRGSGAGRALAVRIIDAARAAGYREMLLDTLPQLRAAIALYETLGFRRIDAYYDTPIADTVFMALTL
jgi:ribosomal protein S18 acetylase RimI-like enzyme